MKKRMFYLTIVFLVAGFCGSAALAFDPIGPPTAQLKGVDRKRVAVEYSWSNMDIGSDNVDSLDQPADTIEGFEFRKAYANFAIGASEESEVFLRVGMAEADVDRNDNADNFAGNIGKSDQSLLLGGGGRATLFKKDKIELGILAQMSYAEFDFGDSSYTLNGHAATLSTDIEIFEVQVAFGPTVEVHKNISIYGGPFLHFVAGDADLSGTIDGASRDVDTDLEQDSILGGYIGAQLDITENTGFNIEIQATDAGYAVAASLGYKY
jgi:hypothetical protein